jgi:hypothetical protein
MVRHRVCRRSERSEPAMFWEADDQEICVLALGCSNDSGHLASVDQDCLRLSSSPSESTGGETIAAIS